MSLLDASRDFIAELVRNYEDMVRALSVFRRLAEGLGKKFTVEAICKEVVKVLAEELHLENCSIMLLRGDELTIEAGVSGCGEGEGKGRMKIGEGIAGRALKEGRPILVEDAEKEARFLRFPMEVEIGSLLSIPIIREDRIKGVINMSHPRKNFFNPRQVDVLNLLSLIVGILIEFAEEEERLEAKVKERTKELEDTKSYLEGILNNASDLILTINRDGRITFVNRKIEDFGFSSDELRGRFYYVLTGFSIERSRLRAVLKQGLFMWEVEVPTPCKGMRRFSCNVSAVRKKGKIVYFLVMARDVTEKRRIEESMRSVEKLAFLGETAAGIAHELNNRLVPVVGYSELLLSKGRDERERRMFKLIHESALGCRSIVQSLLGFAREKEPKKRPLNPNSLVEKVLSLFTYKLGGAGIRLIKRLAPDTPIIMVDHYQLEQVLINLINNAIQAMEGGGTLTVTTGWNETGIFITVEDTGCGIPEHLIDRIFDPFFTTKKDGKGTGLGLSVSYGIVKSHGGEIKVRSNVGRGTIFTIVLPLGPVTTEEERVIPATSSRTMSKRILVIDDDRLVGDMIKEVLSDAGYRVECVDTPQLCIPLVEEGGLDLLIIDIRMPKLDGRKLYQVIVGTRPEFKDKIVFMTGDLLDLDRGLKDFIERTGAPCLKKPFAPSDLLKVVERMLGVER